MTLPPILKPPLGVMPEWRHLELRQAALQAAIARYVSAEHSPNPLWFAELKHNASRLSHLASIGQCTFQTPPPEETILP